MPVFIDFLRALERMRFARESLFDDTGAETRGQRTGITDQGIERQSGLGLWFPTLFAENAKRMGNPA
jgi:hypothetical protein